MEITLLRDYLFVHNKKYFEDVGYTFENAIIENAVLGVHMQYRDRMYMTIRGKNFYLCDSSTPVGPYLGSLMTFLADFFEENQGGGFTIDQLNNKYVRLIMLGEEVVGFGHILKDQFVLLGDVFGTTSKLWRKSE